MNHRMFILNLLCQHYPAVNILLAHLHQKGTKVTLTTGYTFWGKVTGIQLALLNITIFLVHVTVLHIRVYSMSYCQKWIYWVFHTKPAMCWYFKTTMDNHKEIAWLVFAHRPEVGGVGGCVTELKEVEGGTGVVATNIRKRFFAIILDTDELHGQTSCCSNIPGWPYLPFVCFMLDCLHCYGQRTFRVKTQCRKVKVIKLYQLVSIFEITKLVHRLLIVWSTSFAGRKNHNLFFRVRFHNALYHQGQDKVVVSVDDPYKGRQALKTVIRRDYPNDSVTKEFCITLPKTYNNFYAVGSYWLRDSDSTWHI